MSEQYCLICHKDIRNEGSFKEMFYSDDVLCCNCRSQMNAYPKKIKTGKLKVKSFYAYDNLARDMILQYKEYGDEALYPLFLYPYISEIKRQYKDYVIVPAPSSLMQTIRRGFKHVNLLYSILDMKIEDVLIKTEDIEQKNQNKEQRENISKIIALKPGAVLPDRKILVVDDIVTTGGTLRAINNIFEGKCKELSFMTVCYSKQYLSFNESVFKNVIEKCE